MSDSIRVRFAPSPTGHLHIGNARTAILNWLFARHAGGKFILRIEDTDSERSTGASEKSILEDLRWLGLPWDEGPDIGGPVGPYRQSERLEIYRQYVEKLLAGGEAYLCYCTPDELAAQREQALAAGADPKYSGRCRALGRDQRESFERAGRKPVVRFLVPEKPLRFQDLVRGEVTFPAGIIGDFVIQRADGMPTYNFAAVIDDGLMKISHVIRGDDHVSNTPKQIAIYEALGWPVPQFVHIPMILGRDRTRLSKRHGATSVDSYAAAGYLPEALVNYLSLLSWSSETGDEVLSRERLIEEFDFARLSRSAAVFDEVKLTWMNGIYIRDLSLSELADRARPFMERAGYKLPEQPILEKIMRVVRQSLEKLEDVIAKTEMFFVDYPAPENAEAVACLDREASQKVFWSFLRLLDRVENLDEARFREIMNQIGKDTGVLGKDLWMPVRVALTGKMHGPELPLVAEIYGKARCKKLLEKWLDT